MIDLRYQFMPTGDPRDIWVIMDDDYNPEYGAPQTVSGAILLPSPNTMVIGQDMPQDAQYAIYCEDLKKPEVRNFLISIVVGSLKNGLNVHLCPGTSPAELFVPQLIHYIQVIYGVTVGGDTGNMYAINPAYFNALALEANAFGITDCTPENMWKWMAGGKPINPCVREAPHANLFEEVIQKMCL